MPKKSKKDTFTVEAAAGLWLGDIRISVKESTYTRYHRAVKKYILPQLGPLPLSQVDSFCVNRFTEWLMTEGGIRGSGLSPKTATDVLCVLRSVLKFARISGIPCANTDGIRYPPRKNRRVQVLSGDIRADLEQIVLNRRDSTSIGVMLSLFAGLRIGEVCGLKWGDIDMKAGLLYVRRTVERIADLDPDAVCRTKVIISEPKTDCSLRVIPLPAFLIQTLYSAAGDSDSFVLTGSSRPLEPHCYYTRYQKFMRDHRLEGYSFHALRHTFATRCVEVGFDTKSLSEILGHTNISTTLAFYVHPSVEQKRSQMEKLTPVLMD